MKKTKTTGKRRAAAKAVDPVAAKAFEARIDKMIGPDVEKSWKWFVYAVLNRRREVLEQNEDELATKADCELGIGQLLSVLGEMVALRRLSTAQLLELGSSEEAVQICAEAFARGHIEPAGVGQVVRFPHYLWRSDPLPKEAPPEEKDEDETFARDEEPEK